MLYETDKTQFQIKFGELVEDRREHKPHDYILGLVRHIVSNRRRLPVIVFDNADHFDITFQEMVYQYARSIYESTMCLIILPITDRTSWQLSRHGALQSFDHESLFLPTPEADRVISQRINFLQRRVHDSNRLRPDDSYFVKRGITLSIRDLQGFTDSLQRIFLETDDISHWIGNLANTDVRRALRLARQFVTSAHLRVEDLLRAYLANTARSVSRHNAMNAILRGSYDIYPVGQSEFVQNVCGLVDAVDTSPLVGLSILQLLEDAPPDDARDQLLTVTQILQYCEALGYENLTTRSWLDSLLKSALCFDYDPTVTNIDDATRLEITPAGRQHMFWGRYNFDYLSTMADVSPITNRDVFEGMLGAISRGGAGWRVKTMRFVDYLLAEDAHYCIVPTHPAYEGQRRLRATLESTRGQLAAQHERYGTR